MNTDDDKQLRFQKLQQMQALPLNAKIAASLRWIREWFDVYPDAPVSFSGGKDSTVLLHLVRSIKPDTKATFFNTGLEFPEIVDFVNSTPNVETRRPKLDFLTVVRSTGYPVVSKRVSQYVGEVQRTKSENMVRLRKTGIRKDGSHSPLAKVSGCWQHLFDAPFKISDQCCTHLKKSCIKSDEPGFVGTMASDGDQRRASYLRDGCNAFHAERPSSRPLSFWLESDIWEYLRTFDVPYSKIYDMGYSRTGCVFCMFGLKFEPRDDTRFHKLAKTHPQLYRWCVDGPLNLREVIRFVHKIELPPAVEDWML